MAKPLAIVPTYLRKVTDIQMTETCLRTLRETADDACDVMVVDDGSPERDLVNGLAELCKKYDGELVDKRRNEGFSKTVNVGLRRALVEGRDAVLVNNDIEFGLTRGWLRLMQQQVRDDQGLASVVGALLLYPNGLIQHCSPGTERVRTHRDGYVALQDLDEESQGLVSYDRRVGRVFAGERKGKAPKAPTGGYPFRVSSRHYVGAMLEVESVHGRARVTPNHKLTIRWAEAAFGSWVVYLMRQGTKWRIGKTRLFQNNGVFGPGLRLRKQQGDDLWIVGSCRDEETAWQLELLTAWNYNLPTWEFLASGVPSYAHRAQTRLNALWAAVGVEPAAHELLRARGMQADLPLVSRSFGRAWPMSRSARPMIYAANLDPTLMRIPAFDNSEHPTWDEFSVARERFAGRVYSLDVAPHEHYVNEGLIVHNSGIHFSLLSREFDHRFRFGPGNLPEAQVATVCPVTGALMFIRHECLEAVGVFDESFRMGWEDVDYNVRVWKSGRQCIYQPGIRAIHHESATRGQGRADEKITKWTQDSWLRFCAKWGDQSFAEFVPMLTIQ